MNQEWLLSFDSKIGVPQSESHNVFVIDDVRIPPHGRVAIPVKLTGFVEDNVRYQFADKDMLDRKNLYCTAGNSLTPPVIFVTNVNNVTTTLWNDTCIGSITTLPSELGSAQGNCFNATGQVARVSTSLDVGGEIKDLAGNLIDLNPNLTPEQYSRARALVEEYLDVFARDAEDLEEARVPPCSFEVRSETPVASPPYKLSKVERDEMDRQVTELEKAGVIEKSRSCWTSPALLIKKPNNKFRLVVNYTKLNTLIVPDRYPLARIDTILDTLESSKFFSSMDINQAFFQIPLKERCRKYTAFITHKGVYSFKRLAMGLSISSQCFSRVINQVFADQLYHGVVVYVDDVCSYASDFESALARLKSVFERLREANLKIKTEKCRFLYQEVELLGHKISHDGIQPLSNRVEAMLKIPTPKTLKDVRRFIGATSYYRKFIKGYSTIAYPLTELLKKNKEGNKKIVWELEHEEAFNALKNELANPPVLAFFSDQKQTVLRTDASRGGIAGELLQYQEDGSLRPVAYVSRKISGTENKWSVSELELLAIVFSVTHFRSWLYGKYFEVQSDHSALQFYKNIKCVSSRLNRLALKLTDYDFKIVYKTGPCMRLSDLLSRYPINKEVEVEAVKEEFDINVIKTVNIRTLQLEDEYLFKIRAAIIDPENADCRIRRAARLFVLRDDVLYYKHFTPYQAKFVLALPSCLVEDVLKAYHESLSAGAHSGVSKTIGKIRDKYYWKNMVSDIRRNVTSCLKCQVNKPDRQRPVGLLQPIVPPVKPFSVIVLDYLGALPLSNRKKYILVCLDSTTRYAVVKATEKADSQTTARFILECVVPRFGVPAVVRSDRGGHLVADVLKQLYSALGIEMRPSTAYHPQTQGVVERYNSTLLTMLKGYVNSNHSDWSKYVEMVTFVYNTSVQESTGYSPFYLLHGFVATQPIDLAILPKVPDHDVLQAMTALHKIRERLPEAFSKAQNIQAKRYNLRRREVAYKVGEQVLLETPFTAKQGTRKLAPLYSGPYRITKVLSPLNYELEMIKAGKWARDVVHVSRLKRYHGGVMDDGG